MLSKLFRKKEQGIIGYIYVADCDEGVLRNATEGRVIKNEKKGPPWIVVDHVINNITIAKWPGTLWCAEIIDEAKDTGLLDYAKYSRANKVKILEKLSLDTLFGEHGDGILKIIKSASMIDLGTAEKLSSILPKEGSELYSKGWNIFGGTVNEQPPYYGRIHTDTIEIPGDEGNSPINNGFSIVYSQIFDRASELTNGEAIWADEEGNAHLNDTWSKASSAYLFAAMAIAYQNIFCESEIKILSKAWVEIHGELPLKA